MSAFGAVIGKGFTGLGGPGAAAAIVAGGILVGALGGGIAATQGSGPRPASATGQLAVYACPDTGSPLVLIRGGQKLLVTGRTADGAWLRIHFPEPVRPEAWVQASPLQVAGTVASLPVAECSPELAVGSPTIEPAMSLTAVANNPPTDAPSSSPEVTPSPEVPPSPEVTPSTSPSVAPNARPTLASLTTSTNKISYDTGDYCPKAVKKVTFRVKAGDAVGVESVALFWREPGASSYAKASMTRISGNAKSGTWQVTLDTTANGITGAGRLAFYAVATDGQGSTRRIPANGPNTINVAVCLNTGPTITSVSPASGTSISWDPLSVSSPDCQTARNITATVKDGDGVKSVTLFYRKPGSSTWLSKPMDSQTIPGKWFANLDTLGDQISITDPPTDNLRWYIKAVDDKGKASQLATRTLVVERCDTEAQFGQSSYSPSLLCLSKPTTFYGSARDEDGINGSSAEFVYTYLLTDGTQKTVKRQMAGNNDGAWYYQVSLQADPSWRTSRDTVTFFIRTTDRFGGVSEGGSGKITVTSC